MDVVPFDRAFDLELGRSMGTFHEAICHVFRVTEKPSLYLSKTWTRHGNFMGSPFVLWDIDTFGAPTLPGPSRLSPLVARAKAAATGAEATGAGWFRGFGLPSSDWTRNDMKKKQTPTDEQKIRWRFHGFWTNGDFCARSFAVHPAGRACRGHSVDKKRPFQEQWVDKSTEAISTERLDLKTEPFGVLLWLRNTRSGQCSKCLSDILPVLTGPQNSKSDGFQPDLPVVTFFFDFWPTGFLLKKVTNFFRPKPVRRGLLGCQQDLLRRADFFCRSCFFSYSTNCFNVKDVSNISHLWTFNNKEQ